MGTRIAIVITSLATAAIGLTACGSDGQQASPAATSAAATTAVAPPTPDQLKKLLDTLIDPNQPAVEKAKHITNGRNKIPKLEEFSKKLGGYQVGFSPTKITVAGAGAGSEVLVTSPMAPNAPAPVPMTFDFAEQWRISEASTCAIFAFAQVKC